MSRRTSSRAAPGQTAPGTAVIVGASLSGPMTALVLPRAGLKVTLPAKSGDSGRTSAANSEER